MHHDTDLTIYSVKYNHQLAVSAVMYAVKSNWLFYIKVFFLNITDLFNQFCILV